MQGCTVYGPKDGIQGGQRSVALDTRLRGYDGKEGSSTTGFQPMQG
ncbi:MAG: hypothetical protein ABW168_27400 [Sedimenticola sp.]